MSEGGEITYNKAIVSNLQIRSSFITIYLNIILGDTCVLHTFHVIS